MAFHSGCGGTFNSEILSASVLLTASCKKGDKCAEVFESDIENEFDIVTSHIPTTNFNDKKRFYFTLVFVISCSNYVSPFHYSGIKIRSFHKIVMVSDLIVFGFY